MLEALRVHYKQSPTNILHTFQKTVAKWKRNMQTRHVLQNLDDWQLENIVINWKTAKSEGIKEFWYQRTVSYLLTQVSLE